MKSITKSQMAHIAALLVLATLLCAGVRAAVAAEQTLIVGKGVATPSDMDFGTDPTISNEVLQGTGRQYHHFFTHYSPLIDLDTNGNIVPWMAESYEVSDDHKTITFHLRKGIKFADGTPLNASILKFNCDRILGYGWNTEKYMSLPTKYYDSSEALDDYTLRIRFTQGWLKMARDLSGASLLSIVISPLDIEPAWDIKGTLKSEKRYNGLGPYYVDENESIPNQKVVLKRRHSWQDDLDFRKPKLDKIVFIEIANIETAVMALEKGEINLIDRYSNPPLEILIRLEKNPDITLMSRPAPKTYFISTAYWKEPFNGSDGILLRKAINYALDRVEIAEGAFFGYATPATGTMYLSPQWASVPECCHKGYDYNIDKAKQILSDAGWKDTDGDSILDKNGKSLKDLNLVVSSSSDMNWMPATALIVQSQLRKVGIDIKIQTLEYSAFQDSLMNGDFDLAMGYAMGSPELTRFNSSLSTRKNPIYANENNTLGKIAYKSVTAMREEELAEYFCQVCTILHEDAGTIPLVHPMVYAVMSSKVKGYEFGASSYGEHIEGCWIK